MTQFQCTTPHLFKIWSFNQSLRQAVASSFFISVRNCMSFSTVASGLDDHSFSNSSVGFCDCPKFVIKFLANPIFSPSMRKSLKRNSSFILSARQISLRTLYGMCSTLKDRSVRATLGWSLFNSLSSEFSLWISSMPPPICRKEMKLVRIGYPLCC